MDVPIALPVRSFGDAFSDYQVVVRDGRHSDGRVSPGGRMQWVKTSTDKQYEFLGVTTDVEAYATAAEAGQAFEWRAHSNRPQAPDPAAEKMARSGGSGERRFYLTAVHEELGQFGERTGRYYSELVVQRGNLLMTVSSHTDPGDGSDKRGPIDDLAHRLLRIPASAP